MAKTIISKGIGAPDFKGIEVHRSRSVVSKAAVHFTGSLAKNASEQENLTGLVSNRIIIRNVAIDSVQPLHFRLSFYSKDTFTDSDLNVDAFVGAVEFNIPTYGRSVRSIIINPKEAGIWKREAALPFTPGGANQVGFSPIISTEEGRDYLVYVVDWSANFYRYSFRSKTYTQLASPAYNSTNCVATLALSPNGKKLALITDRDGEAGAPTGHRIEVYDIAADRWDTSSQAPVIIAVKGRILSIVWQDNTTLWAWAKDGANATGKCIKYIPGSDTWTVYSTARPADNWLAAVSAAMNDTDVYGILAWAGYYFIKYNIAADTYTLHAITPLGTGNRGLHTYDRDKLWFYDVGNEADGRPGYISTLNDSQNDDQFIENTQRASTWDVMRGIKDDLSSIMALALDVSPWVMSLEIPPSYSMNVKGVNLPYEDLDGTKELHVILKNLSPTSKISGANGQVKIEVDYEPAA